MKIVKWSQGVSENRRNDQQRGIFSMYKSFFRDTLCIARKNEAVERKRGRCLGVLMVFGYALNCKKGVKNAQADDPPEQKCYSSSAFLASSMILAWFICGTSS